MTSSDMAQVVFGLFVASTVLFNMWVFGTLHWACNTPELFHGDWPDA